MSAATVPAPAAAPLRRPGFGAVLHAEWVKLTSVRSTWWTLLTLVVLGAGLTTLICATNADWLASAEADESAGSFITWGMMFAQIPAVVLGALAVTTEYGNQMVQTTLTAVPARGRVLAAKGLLLTALLLVVGAATATLGYVGGNWFLEREGIGIPLEGEMVRALLGCGIAMAGIGLLTVGLGFVLRHTAGTISLGLALLLILPNLVILVPGEVGEWLVKLMPGNAITPIAVPTPFNPMLLDPWPGVGVFAAETAVVLGLGWLLLRRRDA